ncbi:hypothetical protein NDN08_004249 [Rhodosorus marinus]|uniref:Right handed beta helix domain-containing protein n=1 Tax=Rhodosorus marinus TaxID=101924 RepID=A0AAV8UPA6_9RHOD|nr:hypothetical protein NDN08_004249 [Rhodosorus marinus]
MRTSMLLGLFALCASCAWAETITLKCDEELRAQVQGAEAGNVLLAGGGCMWTIDKPVRVSVPLTIRGVHARVKNGKFIPIFDVRGDNVTITDCRLVGNFGTIFETRRRPLIYARGSNFVMERLKFFKGSKDGIEVVPRNSQTNPIRNGLIRDIVGYDMNRDVVAIDGNGRDDGSGGDFISNITIDNVRSHTSLQAGAVEVSDGVSDISVRNVYAIDSIYALTIQDHLAVTEENRRIIASNIVADYSNYTFFAETNFTVAHRDVDIRRVMSYKCQKSVFFSHIDNTTATDVRSRHSLNPENDADVIDCNQFTGIDWNFFGNPHPRGYVALRASGSLDVTLKGMIINPKSFYKGGILFVEDVDATEPQLDLSESDLSDALVFETSFVEGTPTPTPSPTATERPPTPSPTLPPSPTATPSQAPNVEPEVEINCAMDLQAQIDAAPPYTTLKAPDGECCNLFTSETFVLAKPLTIAGLCVSLNPGVERKPIFLIQAQEVVILDSVLTGNIGTVDVRKGAPLIIARDSHFAVKGSRLDFSSSHAILVQGSPHKAVLEGGVLRNITGKGNLGSMVNVRGGMHRFGTTRHIVVENIYAEDSKYGGALEMGDGVQDIWADSLSALRCARAVAVWDHGRRRLHVLQRIFVTNVRAEDCKLGLGVRGSKNGFDFSAEGLVAKHCETALAIKGVDYARVYDIVTENAEFTRSQIQVEDAFGTALRHLHFATGRGQAAIFVKASNDVIISDASLAPGTHFQYGLAFDEDNQHPWSAIIFDPNLLDFSNAAISPVVVF